MSTVVCICPSVRHEHCSCWCRRFRPVECSSRPPLLWPPRFSSAPKRRGKTRSSRWTRWVKGLPPTFVPPPPFVPLAPNEIVVQYPAVTFSRSEWSAAPPPIIGERAVFIFRKCWYCLPIRGLAFRGPYYQAHPLVAQSWGSKLDPAEWPRVTHLLPKLQRLRKPRASSEASRPEFFP